MANCLAGNGNTCRLRDALAAVNAGQATGTTITFAANETIALLNGAGPGTLTLALASGTETIDGGGHTVVVDGNSAVTVFVVNANVSATLNALTIRHGNTSNNGGGIANGGTLTVTNSTFTGNTANNGGGIDNESGGTATVTNSTLSGNSGPYGGGINSHGPFTLTNTIVAKNTATSSGPDAFGVFTDGGDLIGDGTNAAGLTNGTNGDQVGTPDDPINPLLAPLGNYGGPTQTMAPPRQPGH